jgi:large subunit ribosomal protein L35
MPKMKTHSGAKKRFKLTAKGKVRGRHAMTSHILGKKSAKRKRKLSNDVEVAPSQAKNIKKNLLLK